MGASPACYSESRTIMKNLVISVIAAATVLGSGGAAAAAPLTCVDGGSATQCASPGNVQITTNTPPVQFQPMFPFISVGGIYHR